MSTFVAKIDRDQEKRMLKAYGPAEVQLAIKKAALVGAEAAKQVMQSKAPVGTAARLSQFYRKLGLQHGALRSSVRAAAIRVRGSAIMTIGPMGRAAVARAFVAHRNPWVARTAPAAFSVARMASEAYLARYTREH